MFLELQHAPSPCNAEAVSSSDVRHNVPLSLMCGSHNG
uniref:Uncharacterized protein n=1 Tax=Arundo donax TaxID=35708 RepID=A0A0A9FQJ6_ARUDO